MHRTPLQDRHLLRIRRRYAADYLLYGLLPEQGQLEARERILSCFQWVWKWEKYTAADPHRSQTLENFYAAPEEEQYFLRKYPDTYSPIDIKLLEKAGTLEILTWNDMNWFALIMRSEQSFYHWQKLYRVISLGQPNRKNRCLWRLNREDRCDADTVPPL